MDESSKTTWFGSMFSADAEKNDVMKARVLNVTKVTGLLAPLSTAVALAVGTQVDDGPLSGLTPGQRLILWISMFAFVGLVVITDMIVRATVTAASLQSPAIPLPGGIHAQFLGIRPFPRCSVVAARPFDGQENTDNGEYLITFGDDDKLVAKWVDASQLAFAA